MENNYNFIFIFIITCHTEQCSQKTDTLHIDQFSKIWFTNKFKTAGMACPRTYRTSCLHQSHQDSPPSHHTRDATLCSRQSHTRTRVFHRLALELPYLRREGLEEFHGVLRLSQHDYKWRIFIIEVGPFFCYIIVQG